MQAAQNSRPQALFGPAGTGMFWYSMSRSWQPWAVVAQDLRVCQAVGLQEWLCVPKTDPARQS